MDEEAGEKSGDFSRMSVEQDGERSMTPTMQDNGNSKQLVTPSPLLDIHKGRPVRLQVRVLVPVKDHPNFNFVGKLLGPKGNSLKRLQEETQTKMAILGRGSMRDKAKEEDLRKLGDPKHAHLNEELHVEITSFAPAADAYGRLAHALAEVKRFLVPDYYDDIRQHQLRELAILNGDRKKGKGNGEVSDGNYDDADDDRSNGPSPGPQSGPRTVYGRHQAPPGTAPIGATSKVAITTRNSGNAAAAPRHLRRTYRQTASGQTRVTTYLTKEPRVQYISDEDYVYDEGYPADAPEVVTKQFPRLRSAAFVDYDEHLSPDEVGDVYEGNGYGPKEFVGEEWVATSRGMPVSRLKTAGRGVSRPVVYREHPYFPASVTRY